MKKHTDKELENLLKYWDDSIVEKASPLEVMENDRQLWSFVEYFEKLKEKRDPRLEKLGKWIEWKFGVDLQAN